MNHRKMLAGGGNIGKTVARCLLDGFFQFLGWWWWLTAVYAKADQI